MSHIHVVYNYGLTTKINVYALLLVKNVTTNYIMDC